MAQSYRMAKNVEDSIEAYRERRAEHARAKAVADETAKAATKAKEELLLAGTAMDDAKRAMETLLDQTTKPVVE